MKQNQDRYIQELESKIEILEHENARLAERGEDTLLLGIVSEHINVVDDIDELLHVGLEKISLLKNIPFCACCLPEKGKFVITNYYFLQSNDPLVTTELVFSDEVQGEIQSATPQLIHCGNEYPCPVIEFETMEFFPRSMLIIPARSVLRDPEIFCFAVPDDNEKLSHVRPLLERIVEMISTRIDTLTLMQGMKELNRVLDQKVRERTRELARTNKVLGENEKKFRGLFNEALDMIHFVNAAGEIVDVNPIELRTMQYSREEYLGRALADFIDPALLADTKKSLAKIFSGEEVRGHQSVMIARDGTRVDVEVNAVPEIVDGKVVRAMAIIRNITDRKQMEEKLLKIKKMESIGVLAGGIAHDFNNILAAILGNISLALQYTDPKDNIYSLLTEAEKGSLRAKELTQQLLTFSKGGEPVKEVSSIGDVIRDSAGFVLHGTNVRCTYMFADDLWPVAIDRGQISQVIQNLVINARHAMPTGGEIEVACENFIHEQAHLLPVEPGRYIKLSIRDQGTGIPINHIDRIFDPYFTTKQEGSGLGLAVTHSIVVKHQGHIEVESKNGNGTKFTIYLPASNQEHETVELKNEEKRWSCSGKILLMDDEEMIRSVARNMLSHAGYEVVLASSGEEAIELFKKENDTSAPIDAVILDLTIPGGMGGKETAEMIQKISPDANLIVSSGYSNDPVMASYKEYGFCAAITKPYLFQELMETLEQVFS